MKRTFHLPRRLSSPRGVQLPQVTPSLLFGLVAALAVHALLLSFYQLKRTRLMPPEALQSRDNTPELLQLSSQPAPLASLEVLPLPKATTLPPPPPADLLAPLRSGRPANKTKNSVKSAPLKQPVQLAQAKASTKGGSVKSPVPGRAAVVFLPPAGPDWDAALEQLRSVHKLDASAASPSPSISQDTSPSIEDGAQGKPTREADVAQQEAYQTLWNQARAQPRKLQMAIPGDRRALAIEIRQLPLQTSLAHDLNVRHRQMVVLSDNVLLFWIEGDQLWILQSPRDLPSAS